MQSMSARFFRDDVIITFYGRTFAVHTSCGEESIQATFDPVAFYRLMLMYAQNLDQIPDSVAMN